MSEIQVTAALRRAAAEDDTAPKGTVSSIDLVEQLMGFILDDDPVSAFMLTESLIRSGDAGRINGVICMAIGALVACEKNLRQARGAFDDFDPALKREMVDTVAKRLGVDPSEVKLP